MFGITVGILESFVLHRDLPKTTLCSFYKIMVGHHDFDIFTLTPDIYLINLFDEFKIISRLHLLHKIFFIYKHYKISHIL